MLVFWKCSKQKGKNLQEWDEFEDSIDGGTILKGILKKLGWMVVEWIHLNQDRDKLWGFVNIVMKFRDSINAANVFAGR